MLLLSYTISHNLQRYVSPLSDYPTLTWFHSILVIVSLGIGWEEAGRAVRANVTSLAGTPVQTSLSSLQKST
jgi:hypothetical protein